MNIQAQPEFNPSPASHKLSDSMRHHKLEDMAQVLAKNYEDHSAHTSRDRDILDAVEKNKGVISGRTALVTEIVLTDYVKDLEERNENIERQLRLAEENINRDNLGVEYQKNLDMIKMIKQNCLSTLGNINDSILEL